MNEFWSSLGEILSGYALLVLGVAVCGAMFAAFWGHVARRTTRRSS